MNLMRFKSFFIGVAILGGAIAIVMVLMSLKSKPEEEDSTKPPLMVKTAQVLSKEQTLYSTFQGEVRAKTDIELVTQVTGKVMSISDKFIEGGEFSAGETLIQIDDADYQVALKSAQASVASAQVDVDLELATAATNAREWKELQGKPIEEANPLRLNKPQIDRAKARLDAAVAELDAAKLNYDRTKISAPFAGRIMKTSAELGQFMSRGSSIGRVFATDTMEVRIPMTDLQISELGLNLGYSSQSNASRIPATVSTLFGDQRRSWAAYVQSVDASVDNETRLLFATVVVDNPFAQGSDASIPLVPGLFVDVELASPTKIKGLELPRTALRNGNQVYLYDDDELRMRSVNVVYTSADRVIVKEGGASKVAVGERIITSSVPGAYDGMPVKLTESATADNQLELQVTEEPIVQEEPSDAEVTGDAAAPTEEASEDAAVPQEAEDPNQAIEQDSSEEEVVTPQSSADDEAPTNAAS